MMEKASQFFAAVKAALKDGGTMPVSAFTPEEKAQVEALISRLIIRKPGGGWDLFEDVDMERNEAALRRVVLAEKICSDLCPGINQCLKNEGIGPLLDTPRGYPEKIQGLTPDYAGRPIVRIACVPCRLLREKRYLDGEERKKGKKGARGW